jgi:hypothetical protein
MKVGRVATQLACTMTGVLFLTGAGSGTQAQESRTHASHHGSSAGKDKTGAFVKTVREATERFWDVEVAENDGYHLAFGCVSGPDSGVMGMHFVNMGLVLDGVLDATRPEIVIYEPQPNGRLRLIGADFLVLAEDWHTKNPTAGPPELGGQLLHLFEAPNRFGLPNFYTLHVWAWKENPTGMFVNWHSKVSCEAFSGQN